MKPKKYRDGGDSTGKRGMMMGKIATADAMGNPSAHRMVQNYPPTYTWTGLEGNEPQGATGTHYMGSYGEYAIPSIQQRYGQMMYIDKPSYRDKEAMKFSSATDAEYFAEHYKEVAPMMRNMERQYGGTINDNSMKKKFKSGGYTVPGYNREAQNGMMQNGGYLQFMQQNPNLAMMQYGGNNGGVMSIDDIGRQPYPQPHKGQGSTMNGSSWSQYGGPQNFLPAPLEYAYLEQGGYIGDVDDPTPEYKSGGWIKDAVNPAHKGYCTPMTKSTCTPKRKAFAKTMKKHHGFHEYGGEVNPNHPLAKYMAYGGDTEGDIPNLPPANGSAWGAASPDQAFGAPLPPQAPQVPVIPVDPNQNTRPPVSPNRANPQETPTDASGFNNPQADQNYAQAPQQQMHHRQPFGTGFNNLLGAGLMATSYFEDRRNARDQADYNRQLGMSQNAFPTQQGTRGDYNSQGIYRPDQMTPGSPGMYYPNRQYGGYQHGGYTQGQELELDEQTIKQLQKQGYKLQFV